MNAVAHGGGNSSTLVGHQIQAVLFDLDGTLLDSLAFLREAFQSFVDSVGIAGPIDHKDYDGLLIHDIVRKLAGANSRPDEATRAADAYVDIIQSAYERDLQPFSGAKEVLTRLRERGLRLGLVTSAVDKMVAPLLARIGWGAIFDAVVCGNWVSRTKPAPDCYIAALASLGLPPESVVAVEDSANGILAAKGAGLTVIGVSSGDQAALLRAAGAVEIIAALERVTDLVSSRESSHD